jgi:predicted HTH domain antitoxin
MCEVTLTIPDETLLALRVTPDRLGAELRLAAAVKLYEIGQLSSGAAAALADVPRPVFLSKLADYGVPTFKMTEQELAEDVRRA